MSAQTRTYLAHATFDRARVAELGKARASHLRHVLRNKERIVFGGLVGARDLPPEGIVLLVKCRSQSGALALMREDPYAPCYSNVRVVEFQLRIPEQREGQLLGDLQRLIAESTDVN